MSADEALTQTYVAALQAVPTHIWSHIPQDDCKKHIERGLDANTMKMLDALAAICVRAPSETYSTALSLETSQVTLLVATTGAVPDLVEHRLRAVWQFMRVLQDLQASGTLSAALQNLAQEFALQQYRFALPALRARLTHDTTIVLDSMRQVLHDTNRSARFEDRVLRSLEMQDFVMTNSHEQLLRRCIASLEKMRSLSAKDSLPDAALLEIALGLQELYGDTKDILEKSHGTVLVLADFICRVPVRAHLRRILWLAEACIVIPAFAVSRLFARLLLKPLCIQRVQPLSQRVAIELREDAIKSTASFVYDCHPEHLPFFDPDFNTHLLEPLRILFADLAVRPSNGTAACVTDVPLHGEMLMLRYFDGLPYGSVSYIGHSELSCLPCYLFMQVYNSCSGQRQVYSRGSNGQTKFPWPIPRLASDTTTQDKIGERFHREVTGHLMSAWRIFAKTLMAERESSGAVIVEDPLPKLDLAVKWFYSWAASNGASQ